MTHDLTDDDIRALRRQGDLRAYLRTLRRPAAPRAVATPRPPTDGTHVPGAWPYGTRADGVVCDPGCACAIRPPPERA